MRPIIIGAGRGSRLARKTDLIPKTMVEVMGRPMLEWILDALKDAGFQKRDVVFICGYAEEVVRERYPEFTFVRNADWQNNNILLSLLCARDHLQDGFISTYADIIYDGAIVQKLVKAEEDLVLGCDTDWRRRYIGRSDHPESDAEKLSSEERAITQLSRNIDGADAQGEFIGVLKATAAGAAQLLSAFDEAEQQYAGGQFREGRTFEKAYLIDLLQVMLERGVPMHRENTHGGYMEIDTVQDHGLAQSWWEGRRAP